MRLYPKTFLAESSAEKLSTIDIGNLGLPLPPISLDLHQIQIQQDDILDWISIEPRFLERELIHCMLHG